MSLHLPLKLLQRGRTALWNASRTGITLNLTHVQLGSGNRVPDGAETSLLEPRQSVAIAAGHLVAAGQIRMSAIFSGEQSYSIREVGLWSGDPALAASILLAYWSQATGELTVKSPGVDFVFSHDLTLDSALPAGSLTVLADTGQSAMLAMMTAHEAKANAHPQYTTEARVTTLISQAQLQTTWPSSGGAAAFQIAPAPTVSAYITGQRWRIRFTAAGNGAGSLNVNNLGERPLKQYDAAGNKQGAVIAAGQVADVEFDGSDFVVLDALPAAEFDMSAANDFYLVMPEGTANVLYSASFTRPRGTYLVTPYSLGWEYANAGGSYYITVYAEFLSGTGNTSFVNLTQDALPLYHRAPFIVRITSPSATLRVCVKNNGSNPPGQGTVTMRAGSHFMTIYGYRIG